MAKLPKNVDWSDLIGQLAGPSQQAKSLYYNTDAAIEIWDMLVAYYGNDLDVMATSMSGVPGSSGSTGAGSKRESIAVLEGTIYSLGQFKNFWTGAAVAQNTHGDILIKILGG